MRKQTVEVAMNHGDTMVVDGYELPESDGTLVVHRYRDGRGESDGTWAVTHVASGLRVPGRFPRRADAVRFGGELVGMPVDWSGSAEQVKAQMGSDGPGWIGGAARAAGAVDEWAYIPRPSRVATHFDMVAAVESMLPAGWSLYDGDDPFGDLECPCGNRIEPDGVCPNGHASPLPI